MESFACITTQAQSATSLALGPVRTTRTREGERSHAYEDVHLKLKGMAHLRATVWLLVGQSLWLFAGHVDLPARSLVNPASE